MTKLQKMEKEFCHGNYEFASSPCETKEFASFSRRLKNALKAELSDGNEIAKYSKGHFDVTGFIRRADGKLFYFSVGDVRSWGVTHYDVMYRTASSLTDYRGGSNRWTNLGNLAQAILSA